MLYREAHNANKTENENPGVEYSKGSDSRDKNLLTDDFRSFLCLLRQMQRK
jgi:hypothetical protein